MKEGKFRVGIGIYLSIRGLVDMIPFRSFSFICLGYEGLKLFFLSMLGILWCLMFFLSFAHDSICYFDELL